MPMTVEIRKPTPQPFFKRYRVAILLILGFAVLQTFTISLPISGRIVDEEGKPIANAEIAVLWQVRAYAIVDTGPAGAVKVSRVATDEAGRYRIPAAFIVHTPMLPFSYLMRTGDMPKLVVVARGHQVATVGNDFFGIDGPASFGGFWFVRASSLRGDDVKLKALDKLLSQRLSARADSNLSFGADEIRLAQSSCKSRFVCVADSTDSVLMLIKENERDLEEMLRM